jgi:energy-coupling factor transporter ATP-binding protein EcfA2
MYKTLSIYGYRGFSKKQTISFAIPEEASKKLGLTMIVGGNNSGKSTIFEAMGLLSQNAQLTIQQKRRNSASECVEIEATFHDDSSSRLSNRPNKYSNLEFVPSDCKTAANGMGTIIKIPSRRHFSEYFHNTTEIGEGLGNHITNNRGDPLNQIGIILRNVHNNSVLRERLNILLREITGIDLDWGIEVSDENVHNHYIKFRFENGSHSSEGLGEGLISLFVILLPFVEENRYPIITIDEP